MLFLSFFSVGILKILFQINVVANSGSTGHIAEELGCLAIAAGWESYIAYGRWACPSQSNLIQVGSKKDIMFHGMKSLLFDRHGFGSRRATLKLITRIERIKPTIIHLHNVHGYYLNCKILFEYLATVGIPVVWTLHDCWSMTGHCVHFQNVECEKWMSGCYRCPNKHDYPASLFLDNSRMNYLEKRRLFKSIGDLTIVPVCNWLDHIVSRSFLFSIKRQVIVNGIDLTVFMPLENRWSLKQIIGVNTRFMILAVATVWGKTKGFCDIQALSSMISEHDVIVMIGLTSQQIKKLPSNIIGIERTENIGRLVEFYSAADVFINPTYQDTFPTVNIEALACGTPVITYDTGGSADIVSTTTGVVVNRGNIQSLFKSIELIKEKGKDYYKQNCRQRAIQYFNKSDRYKDYMALYNQLTDTDCNS